MDVVPEDERTVWCGNLSDKITEEVLYELFLQAAPLERVNIPKDKDGKQCTYGFVTFKHLVSVFYASDLLNGTMLYGRRINIKPRNGNVRQYNIYKANYYANIKGLHMYARYIDTPTQNQRHKEQNYRFNAHRNKEYSKYKDNRRPYKRHHHNYNEDNYNSRYEDRRYESYYNY